MTQNSFIQKRGLKLAEAARMAPCSITTLRRAIKRGDLRASRWMRHLIIPVDELERFIAGEVHRGEEGL